jgi:lipoate-protein ligase A
VRVRLLKTPPWPGSRNMAVDEAVLLHKIPTLRLYGWRPACVSVGYFQNTKREVDIDACGRFGIDIVRRPTGGKAVLHEHELTYSMVFAENRWGNTIIETYKTISRVFLAALRQLGLPVEIRPRGQTRTRSPLCFQAVSHYELVLREKKIVGSAQCRRNGMFLQHGSILLDVDYRKLFSCLRFGAAASGASDLEAFVTGINRERGVGLTADELGEIVAGCARSELDITLEESPLSEDEQRTAEQLDRDKYSTAAWTYRSGPTATDHFL